MIIASFENNGDEFDFEDFSYEIKTLISKMKTTKFFGYGLNLTWRNIAGFTEFETNNPMVLISKLAPKNSDFSMQVKKTDKKNVFEFVVYHHDKPMGENIILMSQAMAKKLKIKETYFN
jgi:hypothetical protein